MADEQSSSPPEKRKRYRFILSSFTQDEREELRNAIQALGGGYTETPVSFTETLFCFTRLTFVVTTLSHVATKLVFKFSELFSYYLLIIYLFVYSLMSATI
jgi:hypothetical protein